MKFQNNILALTLIVGIVGGILYYTNGQSADHTAIVDIKDTVGEIKQGMKASDARQDQMQTTMDQILIRLGGMRHADNR